MHSAPSPLYTKELQRIFELQEETESPDLRISMRARHDLESQVPLMVEVLKWQQEQMGVLYPIQNPAPDPRINTVQMQAAFSEVAAQNLKAAGYDQESLIMTDRADTWRKQVESMTAALSNWDFARTHLKNTHTTESQR